MVSNDVVELYLANVNIAAGEVFYLDANDEANLAINTSASTDEVTGMALQSADAGNYVPGIPNGTTIQVGNTLTAGDVYILGTTAGDVMLATELASSQYLSLVATVTATNQIILNIDNTGTVKA